MGECVRAAHLNVPEQILCHDAGAAKRWFIGRGSRPVVVKPVTSAGTDGVSLCSSEEEVVAKVGALLGRRNRLDILENTVLVQEFTEGAEYAVNAVSLNGLHDVTDIWSYRKVCVNQSYFVYDAIDLIPYEGEVQERLRRYNAGVLDALEIRNGPSHCEIKDAPGPRGCVLVECAARLMGGDILLASKGCADKWQVGATVACFIDPAAFSEAAGLPYRLRAGCMVVFFIARAEGRFLGLRSPERLYGLAGFRGLNLRLRRGERMRRTVDFFTTPGWVFLAHREPAVLEQARDAIRDMEAHGLFELGEE